MPYRVFTLSLLTLSILFFQTAHADVSSFVFITKPQTVLPNSLSKEITIESENQNGVLENVSETFDLEFKSTSPSGVFLGSTGKEAGKTMSKNTAHRTFYYKDSSKGDFVITVTATGRTSKKPYILKQDIKIGEVPVIVSKPSVKEVKIILVQASSSVNDSSSQLEVFNAPKQEGFFSRLVYWPKKLYNFSKRLFIEG